MLRQSLSVFPTCWSLQFSIRLDRADQHIFRLQMIIPVGVWRMDQILPVVDIGVAVYYQIQNLAGWMWEVRVRMNGIGMYLCLLSTCSNSQDNSRAEQVIQGKSNSPANGVHYWQLNDSLSRTLCGVMYLCANILMCQRFFPNRR